MPNNGLHLKDKIIEQLCAGKSQLCIIGLGYVGLPLAMEFSKSVNVLGYDINNERIKELRESKDVNGSFNATDFNHDKLTFISSVKEMTSCDVYIIAVPTPITKHKTPDLSFLHQATETVSSKIKTGDLVIYESTVYPGCTEEECIPMLEKNSGLQLGKQFSVGYSPERINPGDKEHTLKNTVKIISGNDAKGLNLTSQLYGIILEDNLFEVSNIRTAEATKIVENVQRDVNIALVNELSIIFDKLDIDTHEVIEAAGTKWNFMKFYPGLVGGHCISVDPYYLTYKAEELGHYPEVILSGRKVNDDLSHNVALKAVQMISQQQIKLSSSRVLVMGITFKENVRDTRNSKVVDLIQDLQSFQISVDVLDPMAELTHLSHLDSVNFVDEPDGQYHCVIIAVKHDEFRNLTIEHLHKMTLPAGGIIDIKGIYRNQKFERSYWCL